MRSRILALSVLALTACSDDAPPTIADGLSMDGLAPARVGMTLAELETAAGPLTVPANIAPNDCFYVSRAAQPGVLFMMAEGTLQRIDVRDGTTPSDTGVRIGDAATKVHETYGGRVEVLPHKYEWESGAQYLTVYSADKSHAVRFNTAGGKIASFQAGNAEPVQFVEGCS